MKRKYGPAEYDYAVSYDIIDGNIDRIICRPLDCAVILYSEEGSTELLGVSTSLIKRANPLQE